MDSGADVIEKLVILRAWGGNFLANMGPCPDGSIPPEALQAWKEIGEWMKHSGESVYGTTGGAFPEKHNQPTTCKGDTVLYAHVFPNFHKRVDLQELTSAPKQAILLRTGEPIAFEYANGCISFQIPSEKRSRKVDTVKLSW